MMDARDVAEHMIKLYGWIIPMDSYVGVKPMMDDVQRVDLNCDSVDLAMQAIVSEFLRVLDLGQ